MSDNIAITSGSGTNVATDDVGGVHYQRVKLVDGTLDSSAAIPGDATNGLDVDVTRVPSDPFGANADAAVTGDVAGSINAHLRGALKTLGDVVASPASNTIGDRLKSLLTGIVLAAGTNVIGKVLISRPTLQGVYYAHSGRQTILATAHGATAGFLWLINPVGSTVIVYVKRIRALFSATANTVFASSPRVTAERVTFTGTASGATISPAKRDSNDATAAALFLTASTGLTLTAGNTIVGFICPIVISGAGVMAIAEQVAQNTRDEDDLVVLRAGEGIVLRQPDNGTASDTRLLTVELEWEER